jgi:hypothetical protein
MVIIGPPVVTTWPDERFIPRVRPGLVSWEHLATAGLIDLTIAEAKARDQRRGFRRDVCLMCRALLAAVSGAGLRARWP